MGIMPGDREERWRRLFRRYALDPEAREPEKDTDKPQNPADALREKAASALLSDPLRRAAPSPRDQRKGR
jgi:hypothetical protein